MIELVCKHNKADNDWICTVYADGEAWFCMLEEEANDMIQKNSVKKFITEDTDTVYVERYYF